MRRSFRDDENAFTGWDALQIGIILAVVAGVLIFWLQYLRRIGRDEAAKAGPWTGGPRPKTLQPGASTGSQKRRCNRCGLTVNPPRAGGPPTCPNCMSVL